MVKTTGCSSRATGFNLHHPHVSSQLFVTPAGYQVHSNKYHTCRQLTNVLKTKIDFLKLFFNLFKVECV